jgi:hypothetical protein
MTIVATARPRWLKSLVISTEPTLGRSSHSVVSVKIGYQ